MEYGHTGSSGRESQEEGILEHAGYLGVHSGQVISSGVSMGIRLNQVACLGHDSVGQTDWGVSGYWGGGWSNITSWNEHLTPDGDHGSNFLFAQPLIHVNPGLNCPCSSSGRAFSVATRSAVGRCRSPVIWSSRTKASVAENVSTLAGAAHIDNDKDCKAMTISTWQRDTTKPLRYSGLLGWGLVEALRSQPYSFSSFTEVTLSKSLALQSHLNTDGSAEPILLLIPFRLPRWSHFLLGESPYESKM